MGLPPITYLAVYKANLRAPESDLCVASTPEFEIKLSPGPIQFSFTVPVSHYAPPAAGMTWAKQHRELPRGSYVLIQIEVDGMDLASARSMAALRVAEAACVFDLCYSGLIPEKLYEGPVDEPGTFLSVQEGSSRLTARPDEDPEDVAERIAGDFASLGALSQEDRGRFRLAARWFRRGQDAINPVDRLLFFWTVVEIYPSMGKLKVANEVSNLLRAKLYQNLSSQQLKEKTKIGQIEGLRGDIVHQGIAFVQPQEEEKILDYVDRLETIAATCLRILAGMAPGDDLDKYVKEN
jgi:hypothetical protein